MNDFVFLQMSSQNISIRNVSDGAERNVPDLQRMVFKPSHRSGHLLGHLVDMKFLVFEIISILTSCQWIEVKMPEDPTNQTIRPMN